MSNVIEITIDAMGPLAREAAHSSGRAQQAAYGKLIEMVATLEMFALTRFPENGYVKEKLAEVTWLAGALVGKRTIPNTPYDRLVPQIETALDSLRSPDCFDVYR